MKTTIDNLKKICLELSEMAEKEAKSLWRLARKAKAHGVSDRLVNEIRNEGWEIWKMRDNPDRLLYWGLENLTKYAFRLGGNK